MQGHFDMSFRSMIQHRVDFYPESLASLPGGEFNDGFQQVVAISFCESPQGLKPDR